MTQHRERLAAPPSWWVGVAAFGLTIGWISWVATTRVGGAIGLVAGLVVAGLLVLRLGSARVEVTPQGLRAGSAFLDAAHVGESVALDRAEFAHRFGPGADVRAYLLTRPYLDRGVLVQVDDPADPTPYWLVSSRRPDRLAAALTALRPSTVQEAPRGQEA